MQRTLLTVAAWLTAGLVASGCTSGWAIEDSPTDADLYAVFGVPGGQVFAVGAGGTVLQRRSSGWRELDSGTEEDLRSISMAERIRRKMDSQPAKRLPGSCNSDQRAPASARDPFVR